MAVNTARLGTVDTGVVHITRERALEGLGLVSVVAVAAILRFANLAVLGFANHYYSAAIEAMLESWHNFFFAAAEPGASVSVDKPPVGLWIQALSAHMLGVNTLGVLLPEIVAGLASVIVLYYLVRRSFGPVAGLIAALALAITPVVVAMDRNNTIDSILILTLLLAAGSFITAAESGRLRYLLLGVTLVGIGFNIKMLQAYLPLPAFYALYGLGSKDRLPAKLGKLALATIVLLVISFSWATMVDLTPADQRPYVGSSADNSEYGLIFGYNGLSRLIGMRFGRGGNTLSGFINGLFQQPPSFGNGRFQPGGANVGRAAGGPGGGFLGTGRQGVLRLVSAPLSKEASWLLPFALLGALLLAFRNRLSWPVGPKHRALVLWGGWLVTSAIFFSIAGFFHEYYLSMLAPPIAALVGIAIAELWSMRENRAWLSMVLFVIAVSVTVWLQTVTASAFIGLVWWMPLVIAVMVAGAVLLLPPLNRTLNMAPAGFACMVTALLVTPGIWSGLTMLNSSANQSLPAAFDGRSSGPANRGRSQVDTALLNYVQPRTQGMKYLMAVPSSMQGADYVLATGRGVLYLGGFMGQDPVETSASLAKLVADGELRFVYWDARGGGRGFGAQTDISRWVSTQCKPVQGHDTATQNSGAPDGTGAGGTGPRGFGAMQVSLYDCGK